METRVSYGKVIDTCEHANETSGPIKSKVFLYQLSDLQLPNDSTQRNI